MAQQKAVEPVVDEVDDLIDELQPGVKLLKGQYTISRYINSGGFGITYLAKDSLDRDVVIKECFPSSVCRRSKVMVAARSRAHTAELRSVVQLFVREARNLAKIVHPNIVSVHQVFEDNGTAYMALDYIDGLDLQQIIDGEGQRPTPAQIVEITDKLIKAVGFIHENDMLHRDISPDNVLIDKKGEPILIDFGAARDKASQTNRAMSALRVVKDGYSPQEFYIAGSEQGPWSDLYALGATLYHLISDEAPINGQARLAALAEDRPDPYVPLTGRFPGFPVG
ncbi:MAG: serine/threonine-protein kinase, partial [Tabrizicola sp.]